MNYALCIMNDIVWNPDVVALSLGSLVIRWYSLCWLIGLIGGYFIVQWLYKDQKIPQEKFEPLFMYCFIGILAGARLGHCLFYQPDYFLSSGQHFVEMFLPIHFLPDGDWKFTGYEGLASHGGTTGLIIAAWIYCSKYKMPWKQLYDNVCIAVPFCAGMIRMGNLMNSEIIGKITDVPWAFIFEQVDKVPRHPGQLYEAIAYFILFIIGLCLYCSRKKEVGRGFYFGFLLFYIFTFRFFIEFLKADQVDFEQGMLLNMGQLLSIPFALAGAYMVWRSRKV